MNMTNIFKGTSFPQHRFGKMTESHPLCHTTGEFWSVTALLGVMKIHI